MKKWTRAMYQPNKPLHGRTYVTVCDEHIQLAAQAAEEGMVLLKNEDHLLPLAAGEKIALFGKGSFDYVKGGGGSGDVHTIYVRNLYEGLKEAGAQLFEPLSDYYKKDVDRQYAEGTTPGMTVEPTLPTDLLAGAADFADTAIVTISRFSGEGWDRSSIEYEGEFNPWGHETSLPQIAGQIFPDGDFYLTAAEKAMIAAVKEKFSRVIVTVNAGGMVDTSWIKDDAGLGAALLMFQAGMEGGSAAARILFGKINPSGRLTDTYARTIEDYPSTEGFHESVDYVNYTEDIYVGYRYFETIPGAADAVVYPFGYGLSYTTFSHKVLFGGATEDGVSFLVKVTNTGDVAGKDVVQLYFGAPQGVLGKPAKALGAFAKTGLLAPGASEDVILTVSKYQMASYDDLGKIQKSAYVLDKGSYTFHIGESVRDTFQTEYVLTLEADEIVEQLSAKLVPPLMSKRLLADGSYEELPQGEPKDFNECIFEKMEPGTEEALFPGVRSYGRYLLMKPYRDGVRPLIDVAEGKLSLDEFMAQMSDEDLIWLLGGRANTGVANTCGFGGMPEYGIPAVMTADGPAGVRINPECEIKTTAWPCETLLASTWNTDLMYAVGKASGEELKENNLQIWLAPAVNIHRNPLCGRNFEYMSEDPYLTAKMAAAEIRGIQSNNVACSLKHFVANNKETNRKHSDSRLSERALREIYLKVFEIVVKESDPWTIMSAYNVVNGQRASESKELLTDILRGEWGFKGMVTSDWWNRAEHYKEILAGNDVKMATGFEDRVQKAMELGALTRSDLENCAKHVLELILKLD